MIGGRILHGGDYNPDQWLKYPGVFEEDIRLMKEAHVNCVSLGIFSWALLEPEEGVYEIDWLENIIDRLGENGIQVVLATPSGAMPHWLNDKYPETMQVRADGKRNLTGKRHNFCYSSPVMKEKITALNSELSKRLGRKENVILWHISNELGGNFEDATCHCELCQEAFREWLKEKYKTLDALNDAWWATFWSHTYTDWNQIHSPVPHGEWTTSGLTLDWRRFSSDQISKFCGMEIKAVKEYSDLPATTNLMQFFDGIDYGRLQKELDVVSWDSYPEWHKSKDEVPVAVWTAANHNIMRSFQKKPFLLMESTPSQVSWRNCNPLKRPGMHMLASMQAIAHGSDSVQYFQWRKGRGAYEKFHGAVVDHKNGSNTRTFREVTEVGKRLEGLSGQVDGTINRPKAAIIFDWINWWGIQGMAGPRLDLDYADRLCAHYRAFWEAGIEADIVGMDDSLEGYELVAAPMNYLYKSGYAEKVEQFVKNGGTFVTTYFSGLVDETDLCFLGHHPLEDVLGIIPEETDAMEEDFNNRFSYEGNSYEVVRICDLVHAKEGTKVLAQYEKDFYAGYPMLTEHPYGEGKAYYIAGQSEDGFLKAFYGNVFKEIGLENALRAELPYGVTVTERTSEDGSRLVFVMNFSHEPAEITLEGKWTDAESGEEYDGKLALDRLSCKVLV